MSNLQRGPSIHASYQVSIHLAKRFQRRRFFRNQPIRNKNCLWTPCLLTDRDEMSTLHREPSIDASYHVSVIWPSDFRGIFLLEIDHSETRIACGGQWPCLLTDWDEISNLHRKPSIYAWYQVSIHLAKRFQRRNFFRNRPIRNKNCLWWPCLLTDRDKIINLYRRLSIVQYNSTLTYIEATFRVTR